MVVTDLIKTHPLLFHGQAAYGFINQPTLSSALRQLSSFMSAFQLYERFSALRTLSKAFTRKVID